jgi:MAP/microtubule affinity-regulating kinase
MKDKWMNMGYEEEELKPFTEPVLDITDEKRIDLLVTMGYCRAEVQVRARVEKGAVFPCRLLTRHRSIYNLYTYRYAVV